MVASIVIVKSTLVCEHDFWMQWLYICMLCVHEVIKGLAELVTIVKPNVILSQLNVSAVHCFLITTASGGANVQHRRYTYVAAGIKSISPPNRLVTRHRLNDHQRRIMV